MRTAGIAFVAVCSAATILALETLEWRRAADCVGRVCGVAGTVVAQEEADGVTRLYFDPERRDVSVLLVSSLFVTWPQYTGQTIVATGKVRRFGEQIEIVAARPRDIVTAPGTPGPMAAPPSPTEAEPTPAAPPSPTQARPTMAPTPAPPTQAAATAASDDAEVERLRRKVEQLEERVRELEGGR
jgi:hypothetical protein